MDEAHHRRATPRYQDYEHGRLPAYMSDSTNHAGRLTIKTVRLFYLVTPVVFGAIALAILWMRGIPPMDVFRAPKSLTEQLLVGLVAGTVSGIGVGIVVVRASTLASLRAIIRNVFESARPTLFDLFLTSLSAGIAEEFLFRGAVQPWLGIWITSLLFMLAHGVGLKLSLGRLTLGLFVFSASLFLGVILIHVGLVACMVTHLMLDLLVLLQYQRMTTQEPDTSKIHRVFN